MKKFTFIVVLTMFIIIPKVSQAYILDSVSQFNGHYYKIYNFGMTWDEAKKFCENLGDIFVKIYNHNCVGEAYDDIIIDFLKGQTDTDCFPAALPYKVIAHKTGALDGLYDDGGIIYDNYDSSNDAILVIMTENFTSEYTTIEHMKRFARSVCYTQKLTLYAQS